jgi:hypothetical protein
MFQYAFGLELAYRNDLPLRIECSQLRGRGPWSHGAVRELALGELRVEFEEPTPEELEYLGARYYNSLDKKLLRRVRSLFWSEPFPRKASRSEGITVETNFEYNARVFSPYPNGQYLDGYWQSPRYFSSVAQELRPRFQPRRPLGRTTSRLLEEIRNGSIGWWAAWLADVPGERVIAPKKWFADVDVVTKDLMPADWRRN